MNRKSRCAHCRCHFVPNPRIKSQRYCSAKPCQQARKTKWQRDKMATEPDYRANQRDAQRVWQQGHRDYWRHYRHKRDDYRNRNRLLQAQRDQKRRPKPLAKMDASEDLTPLKPGLYRVVPTAPEEAVKMDASAQLYQVIPIT